MTYFDSHLTGRTLRDAAEAAAKRLATEEFDAIMCRGNSGLLFASALGMVMDKYILIVRKTTDNAHSSKKIEGNTWNTRKILIVDDFISSGATMHEIYKEFLANDDLQRNGAEIVGIYVYERDWMTDRKFDFKKDGDYYADTLQTVRVMTKSSEFDPKEDEIDELRRV